MNSYSKPKPAEPAREPEAETGTKSEIDALRNQMLEMQKMLDKLAK